MIKIQNRKKLIVVLSLVLLFGILVYKYFFKDDLKKNLVKDVKAYILLDNNVKSVLREVLSETDEVKLLLDMFNGGIILSFEEGFNTKLVDNNKNLLVLSTGIYLPAVRLKMYKYFDDCGDYQVLKTKFSDELVKRKLIAKDENLYVKRYGDDYLIGSNLNLMKRFDRSYSKREFNENLIKIIAEDYQLVYDLSGKDFLGLKTESLRGKIEIKGNKMKFIGRVYFKDKQSLDSFRTNKNKVIGNYYNDEGIYVDIDGIKSLVFGIFLYNIKYDEQNEFMKNINWKAIIDEASSEFYFVPSKNATLIKYKDSKFINLFFSLLTQNNRGDLTLGTQKFYVEDGLLHVNNKFKKTKPLDANVFLKAKFSSDEVFRFFGEKISSDKKTYIELEGKTNENYIDINIEVDKDIYKQYLSAENTEVK